MTGLLAVGVRQAAEMLSISERTTWREIDEGRLRSFKARGRRLVRVSQIEAYLDRRGNESVPPRRLTAAAVARSAPDVRPTKRPRSACP